MMYFSILTYRLGNVKFFVGFFCEDFYCRNKSRQNGAFACFVCLTAVNIPNFFIKLNWHTVNLTLYH